MCRVSPTVHLRIDEDVLEVWPVEFTTSSSYICDDALLTELLRQVSADHKIASVTADRAYDPHKCHDVIAQREAVAVISPRESAKQWKIETACAVARNEAPWVSKCLGRHSCEDQVDIFAKAAQRPKCTASNALFSAL